MQRLLSSGRAPFTLAPAVQPSAVGNAFPGRHSACRPAFQNRPGLTRRRYSEYKRAEVSEQSEFTVAG